MKYFVSQAPLEGDLENFPEPIGLIKVDETKWEPLWDQLVREHHYLGYESTIGRRVKYLVALGDRVIGAISFCSAAYKLGPRDKYLGWDKSARLAMLPRLVCNNRFLILPWVKIRNLASRVLSLSLKRMRLDWERQYQMEPCMVETFVDSERFSGTCYAADNWVHLGETKGFGRQGNGFVFHGRSKGIYVKILSRRFKRAFDPDVDRLDTDEEELLTMIHGIPWYHPTILEALGISAFLDDPTALDNALKEHIDIFKRFLCRRELLRHMTVMLKGLLSEMSCKTMVNICHDFLGIKKYRGFANFLTNSKWDDEGMLRQYQVELAKLIDDEDGMITGDGCDFPKDGDMSAGVSRQYCGASGKVDNCQASVMVGFAGKHGHGIVDFRLFMPEKWLASDFAKKRKKCRVPEDLQFMTKNKMLSEMINAMHQSGQFHGKYVGVDSAFGHDHDFLDSLPKALVYFADVHSNHEVFVGRPEMALPPYQGRGRRPTRMAPSFPPRKAKDVIDDESSPWNDVVLGNGSKGPVVAQDKYLRVVESRDSKPGKDVWLYARKLSDGTIKYAVCNAPMDALIEDVRKLALMRWSIEQSFRECKENLGMDHYELRTFNGWRRHVLMVLIAHLFTNKLRNQFGYFPDGPGVVPYVDKPVSAQDYAQASVQFQKGQKISHPHIQDRPATKQHLLSVEAVTKIINSKLQKVGEIKDLLDDKLSRAYFDYDRNATSLMVSLQDKFVSR